jgi:hypothetical protein
MFAYMNHYKPPTKKPVNRVDWSDPHLESLLQKTESWKLDNRGNFPPEEVQIHVGWAATVGKPALLVWERDQAMVLETRFTLQEGEHIRVDSHQGESIRTVWGVVIEGREGNRAEDQANGVHVYWLHVR